MSEWIVQIRPRSWLETCSEMDVGGYMSLRKLLAKEVVIRLTEGGFVETVRCFRVPIKSVHYDTAEAALKVRATSDEHSMARVRPNRPGGAP